MKGKKNFISYGRIYKSKDQDLLIKEHLDKIDKKHEEAKKAAWELLNKNKLP